MTGDFSFEHYPLTGALALVASGLVFSLLLAALATNNGTRTSKSYEKRLLFRLEERFARKLIATIDRLRRRRNGR